MKKLLFVTCACTVAVFTISAQTKKIAHRSHSGSNHTFNMEEEDDFGAPPKNYKLKIRKDSTQSASDSIPMQLTDSTRSKNKRDSLPKVIRYVKPSAVKTKQFSKTKS